MERRSSREVGMLNDCTIISVFWQQETSNFSQSIVKNRREMKTLFLTVRMILHAYPEAGVGDGVREGVMAVSLHTQCATSGGYCHAYNAGWTS